LRCYIVDLLRGGLLGMRASVAHRKIDLLPAAPGDPEEEPDDNERKRRQDQKAANESAPLAAGGLRPAARRRIFLSINVFQPGEILSRLYVSGLGRRGIRNADAVITIVPEWLLVH
jgi:hypothetical protein